MRLLPPRQRLPAPPLLCCQACAVCGARSTASCACCHRMLPPIRCCLAAPACWPEECTCSPSYRSPFSLQYMPSFFFGSLLLWFGVQICMDWLYFSFSKLTRPGEALAVWLTAHPACQRHGKQRRGRQWLAQSPRGSNLGPISSEALAVLWSYIPALPTRPHANAPPTTEQALMLGSIAAITRL